MDPQITRILHAVEEGDSRAAEELLPLVYDELRKLAGARLAGERSGHTLQATALVHEAYLRLRRVWGARTLDEAARECFADVDSPRDRAIQFLADFAPDLAINVPHRCPRCHVVVYPDEAVCGKCKTALAPGPLPARAARAVEALAIALRQSRGREMLVFISALAGGEACDEVASYLTFAATGHRTVHVASPGFVSLGKARYVSPQTLGNFPTRLLSLRNLYRLHRATGHQVFHRRLIAAGVKLHRLEHREELDRIVSTILFSEILAASA